MWVILRIFDLDRFLTRISIHYEHPALVPNADTVATLRYDADLGHVLALEDTVLAWFEPFTIESSEKHAVTATECVFVGPLSLHDFVDISC